MGSQHKRISYNRTKRNRKQQEQERKDFADDRLKNDCRTQLPYLDNSPQNLILPTDLPTA